MTTNGSLLTDKKLNELKASGLDSVTLSLDTLHYDKTAQINGTKKTFDLDKVIEGIEVLRAKALNVQQIFEKMSNLNFMFSNS